MITTTALTKSSLLLSLIAPMSAIAFTFPLSQHSDIVGKMQTTIVQKNESLGEIGRRFDLGVYEMIEANQAIDPWLPKAGTEIIIPAKFILPAGPRKGIVINLAEMRLYYFHPSGKYVTTHPIGIGRKGWSTPLGETKITQKKANPSWRPPASIRQHYLRKGKVLPLVVPAGPNNPLGTHALRLAMPSYLIHGTNRPGGIGVRSSSGCIRMFPEDIKSLFNIVPVGTKVRIVHYPYKIGRHHGNIYIEAHKPLSEPQYGGRDLAESLEHSVNLKGIKSSQINWKQATVEAKTANGFPMLINN